MYKLNKNILDILKELTERSPNFIVKGGASLLIRNIEAKLSDYRMSTDIDITTTDYKKGNGPSSQYRPNAFNLKKFLEERGIDFELSTPVGRRSIYNFVINNQKITLESSVPSFEEYSEFDYVLGIRVAKLYKVFADKVVILIEYNANGTDLNGEYIRHLVDIMLMEERYGFDILNEKEKIIESIRDRIKSNPNNDVYIELAYYWKILKNEFLLIDNLNAVNTMIANSDIMLEKIDKVVTRKKINKIEMVINDV